MKREILGTVLVVVSFFSLIAFTTWYEGGFENQSETVDDNEITTDDNQADASEEPVPPVNDTDSSDSILSTSQQNRDPMARNSYDKGQCTHYVFEKVKEDGNKIERRWRDAEHWAERADRDGYDVNDEPQTGAILQTEDGPIGHVAYVEEVFDDGGIQISEMNLHTPHEVTERFIAAGEINAYDFIHPKENTEADDTEDA